MKTESLKARQGANESLLRKIVECKGVVQDDNLVGQFIEYRILRKAVRNYYGGAAHLDDIIQKALRVNSKRNRLIEVVEYAHFDCIMRLGSDFEFELNDVEAVFYKTLEEFLSKNIKVMS